MDTGLDNVNNPFTNSNGSLKNLDLDSDNINLQKSNDGLLLNLTDNFKAKGADISQDIFVTEKSNGTKMSASDIHFDDDFGPETDVDAVDDAFSPVDKDKAFSESLSKVLKDEGIPKSFNDEMKAFTDGLANNNPLDDEFNPFLNNQNKESAKSGTEDSREIDFEEFRGTNREETPTPPADAVHDVGGLEVNPTESDSEDEWNYIKGDQAKPENLPSQPETVVETSEQDDAMSQLNPNAAEFVPVSPTRSIPSPACRALINDEVISQSPKRPVRVDINVPSETEFESEVKSRPSDFDYKNGHDGDDEHNKSGILNGKNIEEILEFQPGSTPAKVPIEELYFGPNAVPFTPRALDQSEAFSTKANYGDDTEHTINTSFNDSELAVPNKEQTDPMSMSFYAEKGETNPFQDDEDLNKVHELPENLDAFLQEVDDIKENVHFNETISDLPEHDPLGIPLDNDQAAIQTTDLDKISQDDEKELASPLEDHDDMLNINPSVDVPSDDPWKSSESNLLDEFVVVSEKLQLDDSNVALLPELEPISGPPSEQVPKAPSPQLNLVALELEEDSPTSPAPLDSSSPIPEGELDLLQSQSPLATKTDLVHLEELSNDHLVETTVADHLNVVQFNHSDDTVETQNPAYDIRFETKSPKTDFEEPSSDNLVGASEPAHLDIDQFSHSEGRSEPQSPACELAPESKSPVIGLEEPTSPVCEFKVGSETVEAEFDPKSEVENIHLENKDHILENLAASPVPACEYSADLGSCEFAPQNLESQSPIDSLPDHKQEEDVTSSIKDDVSFPIEELSPIKSPESLVDASIKAAEPALEVIESTEEQHEDIVKTEVQPQEIPSPEILSGFSCLPVSEPLIQQQVETSEINVLEVSAVVEPTGLSNGFDNFASEFNEQVCVKTDNITPEFAEPAIISPSEESKAIDDVIILTPVTNDADVPIEKIPIEPPSEENKVTDEIVALSPVTTDADTSIKHLGETLSQEMKDIVSLSPVTINADAPIETTQIEPPLEKSKAIDEVIASSLVTTLADIPVERSQIEPIASELHSFISQAEPHIPQIEEPKPIDTLTETPKEIPILTPLPVIPVTPLESKEVKEDEKKASTPALGKKPIGKIDAKKSAATPKVGAPKASPKPAASSPKTGVAPKVLSKIGTAKPAGTAPRTTSTGTSKPLPKPKTATAPKTTEKKPSADLKPAPRTTLAKKPATETLTTRTITRPASTGAKTSPTKTTTPRPTTAPRTSLPKTTSTSLPKTTSSIPPKPTAAAKPRVSLTSRTTTITAASKTTTATSAKTTTTTATRTVSSPKTATAPPKPRTITSTAPKPRVPLSKTVTKSADVEKEKKESANKLTASRSTTVTKTTSGIAGSRTTTTVKKTEIKPSSDRTVSSKTTTSTTRTTTLTKKPGDIKTSSKTKTTKVEKPKQNGIAPTNVTEEIKEITIINDVVNGSESDNLVKDNSPLDNKLIIETSNALIDMNPAD